MEVWEVAPALVEVEAVAGEELVGDGEADVGDRQLVEQAPVGPVEQRRADERLGVAEQERPAEVVEREAGVDDLVDDDHVAAADLQVEVLDQPDPLVTAE